MYDELLSSRWLCLSLSISTSPDADNSLYVCVRVCARASLNFTVRAFNLWSSSVAVDASAEESALNCRAYGIDAAR